MESLALTLWRAGPPQLKRQTLGVTPRSLHNPRLPEAPLASAELVLPNGTKVSIQGTAEEVAALLSRFAGTSAQPAASGTRARTPAARPARTPSKKERTGRKGPTTLVASLAEDGYFKSRRTIGDVQAKLEEGGHIYAMHQLSTPLLRLTRSKVLRRLKEKTGWVYVG